MTSSSNLTTEKYAVLKELIQEWIEREMSDYKESKRSAGINSPGACMAFGAVEAYRQVLLDIEELEKEACVS